MKKSIIKVIVAIIGVIGVVLAALITAGVFFPKRNLEFKVYDSETQ